MWVEKYRKIIIYREKVVCISHCFRTSDMCLMWEGAVQKQTSDLYH